MKRIGACLAAMVVLLCFRFAKAETRMWVFAASEPPQELADTALAVPEESVSVKLTFAGDCTLGDEAEWQGHRNGFCAAVKREGMAYPFLKLQTLFAADDFTIVNLEGVLTNSGEDRQKKQYNFRGGTELAQVLTQGSVECVGLCNNHILDYGARGKSDTRATLDEVGVGYFDEDTLCVLEKDGVRIGVTCTLFTLGDAKAQKLAKQTELLKQLGCAATVHVMHAGKEYLPQAGYSQRSIARAAAEDGAALVVGHHPHIAQNVELLGDTPVVYSLGNCCFGGNLDPSDKTALLLSVEMRFENGALDEMDWTLHPISISGSSSRNDFQPYLLDGEQAQAVIKRVSDASQTALLPFEDGAGAKQQTIRYQ